VVAALALWRGPEGLLRSHFLLLRAVLGVYLAAYFACRVPFAAELYGPAGMISDPSANVSSQYLPVLDAPFASEATAQILLLSFAVAGVLFALGIARRTCAILIWLGLMLLVHRNNLTLNIGLSYLGWLILATVLVPTGEGGVWPSRNSGSNREWRFPRTLTYGAWLVFGLSYTFAGFEKIAQPEWLEGSALRHILQQPLSYSWASSLAEVAPETLLRAASWSALLCECACLGMIVIAPGRLCAWLSLTAMQLGILLSLDLYDLSLAVLLFHALIFDPSWLPRSWQTAT